MQELDSARQVESFILDGAFWPNQQDWQSIFNIADSATRPSRHFRVVDGTAVHVPADPVKAAGGSQWEKAFLTVARIDSTEANEASQRLVDVRAWWWSNVRGRIHQDPLKGLGIYVNEPPRSVVPYPMPEPLTAGDWIGAVQQHAWWEAARQGDKSRHTVRQADGWRQLREAAAVVYDREIRQVLGVVNTHTTRAIAAVQPRERAQAWA